MGTVLPPPANWTDWTTQSSFRIRVAPGAAQKLRDLPIDTQLRLRQMLQDIAELAELVPPDSAHRWRASSGPSLLQLQLGKVTVRYSINEETHTLSLEHVIAPDEQDPFNRAS